MEFNVKDMMADSKFYMGYSRWKESGGYETWDEAVDRVITMHKDRYVDEMNPELESYLNLASEAYKSKEILGAQRALQFGGPQLFKHNARLYNCTVSYTDRPRFFSEAMYLLLCGCGVGFSVQERHISKLPKLKKRYEKKVKVFQVPDTIEGWADSFGVLLSSYFSSDQQFPEYAGCQVHFDYTKIRPKGAEISGGFKAPGPDGLRAALQKCEALLDTEVENGCVAMRPIIAYDFVMHMSDAVLSGGVRRSATICLFSKEDKEMLNAKTGSWFVDNPQRGRSNNSVMLLRNELTRDEWKEIMESVKQSGEPGFIFTDDLDNLYNPCVEIGMQAYDEFGNSGWQFCNLVETNGSKCKTREDFLRICASASALSTFQAGYTKFEYLTEVTKRIVEKEALIGVSITGWMNNPDVLFNEQNMIDGAEVVKDLNKKVAKLLGINQAARTTCVKFSALPE